MNTTQSPLENLVDNAGVKCAQYGLIFFLLSWAFDLPAQGANYFVVNGRKIGIDSMNRQIIKMMDDVGIPGLGLVVINNNKIVFDEVYGYRQVSKKKVNRRSIFEACSLSKSFLVFVAHQLVDEGKLDLDKPLYQYLENSRLQHDPRYKLITGRMVLGHCSGIENWGYMNNPDTLEILNNPGEKFLYSGEGYNYLAKVVEVITQQSFEDYITRRIISPLKLRRTYLKFEPKKLSLSNKLSPSNYAVGHTAFNDEIDKWKNTEPVPSSGFNLIAADYANLILSFFNEEKLSKERIKDILKPIVIVEKNDCSTYTGAGFTIDFCKDDTLISQWGSNGGFKAKFLYSVTNKSGFVFFANHDRGWTAATKVNELTTRFDNSLFGTWADFGSYYPSPAIDLLKIYRERGSNAMFEEIETLAKEEKLTAITLNELATEFHDKDTQVKIKLLESNIELHPELPDAYCLLAQSYMEIYNFDLAYKNFEKAKELNFNKWNIDGEMKTCKEEHAKRTSICANYFPISTRGMSTIQAEDFCTMYGIRTQITSDVGGGENVGWIDTIGEWMDYNINVPASGNYTLVLRIASISPDSQLQLRIGSDILSTIDIPNTNGWQNWDSIRTTVHLPAGNKVLRLYASGPSFNINWFGLTPNENN